MDNSTNKNPYLLQKSHLLKGYKDQTLKPKVVRMLIVTIVILFPFVLDARDQVTLKNKSSFVTIARISKSIDLYFSSKTAASKRNYIAFNKEHSSLDDFPVFIKEDMYNVKRPRDLFKKINDTAIVTYPASVANKTLNDDIPAQSSPGEYKQKAQRRYLTALGLGIGGTTLIVIGNSRSEGEVVTAGATLIITGVIIAITGHYQLVEACKAINREAITLSAAEHGLGLAINF